MQKKKRKRIAEKRISRSRTGYLPNPQEKYYNVPSVKRQRKGQQRQKRKKMSILKRVFAESPEKTGGNRKCY